MRLKKIRTLTIFMILTISIFAFFPSQGFADLESCVVGVSSGRWELLYGRNTVSSGNLTWLSSATGPTRCDYHNTSGMYHIDSNKSLVCHGGTLTQPDCPPIECEVGQHTCPAGWSAGIVRSCAVKEWVCDASEAIPISNYGPPCPPGQCCPR